MKSVSYFLKYPALIGAAVLLGLPAASVYAANWTGPAAGGMFEDAANWSTTYFPGGPGSPAGEDVNRIPGVNGGVQVVNLDADLSTGNPTRNIRVDGGPNTSTTVFNINAGAVMNSTSVGNSLLTINEGGTTTPGGMAAVNVAGALSVGQIRLARDSGTASLNILPGGSLNMTGGGHFEMRQDRSDTRGVFSMSGGTFTSGGNRSLFMGAFRSELEFSASADFDGSNLALRTENGQIGSTDMITVVGSAVDLSFKDVFAHTAAANPNGFVLFNYIADAGGVSSLDALNMLDLNGAAPGDMPSSISIDISAYSGSGPLVLFDYGTLDGTFDTVNVIGGSGSEVLDYDYLGGNQIVLVIPEPSSGVLVMFGLVAGVLRRRR